MQQDQIDLFYFGAATTPAGALIMTIAENRYSTAIRFALPDGTTVAGKLDLETNGSVRTWSSFTFEGDGRTVIGERTEQGVRRDGKRVSIDGDVIPGYACSGLVLELANSADDSIEFTWLPEASDEPVKRAILVRSGTESVDSPVRGTVRDCVKIELTLDGVRTNTYWVKETVVVASDWAGARSFAVPETIVQVLTGSQP